MRKINDGMSNKERFYTKNKSVRTDISNEQYEQIQAMAKREDKSVSAWLKDAIQYYIEYLSEFGV